MLVWFHSNPDIDSIRRAISEINGCASCGNAVYIDEKGRLQPSIDGGQVIFPKTYNESTKFFMNPQFDASAFEEWDYVDD